MVRTGREDPVLAMLALKCTLRLATGASAPRHGIGFSTPGRESRLFQPNLKAGLKGVQPDGREDIPILRSQ